MSYLLKRSRNKVAVRELAAGLTFFTIQLLTKQIACIDAKLALARCLHLHNLWLCTAKQSFAFARFLQNKLYVDKLC